MVTLLTKQGASVAVEDCTFDAIASGINKLPAPIYAIETDDMESVMQVVRATKVPFQFEHEMNENRYDTMFGLIKITNESLQE